MSRTKWAVPVILAFTLIHAMIRSIVSAAQTALSHCCNDDPDTVKGQHPRQYCGEASNMTRKAFRVWSVFGNMVPQY